MVELGRRAIVVIGVRASLMMLSSIALQTAAIGASSPMSAPPRTGARHLVVHDVRCDAAPLERERIAADWTGDAIKRAQFTVRLGNEGVINRVIAVRIDSRRVRFALAMARDGRAIAPWSIDDAPANARIALNAGQFTDAGPWGWVVHRGREWQAPGSGALAGALVVDSSGMTSLLLAGEIAARRARGGVMEAVQSYPMLLGADRRGERVLCEQSGAIDRHHRDTRLAIGTLASGELLVVLTRYEVAGVATRIPIGPTTPEMASLMQRLGATRAMLLDGGLSAQLLTSEGSRIERWPGARRVPLALVGVVVTPN